MAENTGDLPSLINSEKITQAISLYKFPLVFGFLGVILFIVAISLLMKNTSSSSDVVFTTESSPSASFKIRVDIEGAVEKPGVYEMEEGSRVSDALVATGGISANADREWIAKSLNRAAKLVDGGKIYIPSLSEASDGKIPNPKSQIPNPQGENLLGVTTGQVNINTASQAQLEELPGVGPVYAGKIINGRPYMTIEELRTRNILGESLFNKLKNLLSI